jgi:hypothetical protein
MQACYSERPDLVSSEIDDGLAKKICKDPGIEPVK